MSTVRMMSTAQNVTLEIDGRVVLANGFSSGFLEAPPAIETLPKRARDRLLGYLQMVEENRSEPHPVNPLFGPTFENHFDLQVAARAYGVMDLPERTAGTFVDYMLDELSSFSGHTRNTIAGVLHSWGNGKTTDDWMAIWTGQPAVKEPSGEP